MQQKLLRIKMALVEKEKTQLWLARRIGVSPCWLNYILNGWVECPDNLRKKIAKALGQDVGDLFPTIIASKVESVKASLNG